jgi:hypothetical protein
LPVVLDDSGSATEERRRTLTADYVPLGRISVKAELGRSRALREAANRGADAVLLARGTAYGEDQDWRVTSGYGWYGARPWKTKTDTWDLELFRRRE